MTAFASSAISSPALMALDHSHSEVEPCRTTSSRTWPTSMQA